MLRYSHRFYIPKETDLYLQTYGLFTLAITKTSTSADAQWCKKEFEKKNKDMFVITPFVWTLNLEKLLSIRYNKD